MQIIKNENKNNLYKGGKVIGSGGFGCVFHPALTCKNNPELNKKNKTKKYISKLLSKENAKKELIELHNVKKVIKTIPNYEDYFLLDINYCKPENLKPSDLENIQTCESPLKSAGLIKNNKINVKDGYIINSPYGGENLLKIINNKKLKFKEINNLLINLLENAIIPMNKRKFFHNDIKSENVLYKDNKLKLIDFGISQYIPSYPDSKIGTSIYNFVLLFNLPFSIILFNNKFDQILFDYLTNNPSINKKNPNLKLELQLFLIEYYNIWTRDGNYGHERFFNDNVQGLFSIIFKKTNFNSIFIANKVNFVEWIFSEYCLNILGKYVNFKTKKFESIKYFNEVLSKNIDIYGFLSIYIEFLFKNEYPKNLQNEISNILIKYCYSNEYSITAINPKNVINDLKKLNNINKESKSKKINIELLLNLKNKH